MNSPPQKRDRVARSLVTTNAKVRDRLALWIPISAILLLITISAAAIYWAGNDRAETSRLVFSSVLPLLGTWVGTVLAFYFTSDSLRAGADTTAQVLGLQDRLRSTPASVAMIGYDDMDKLELKKGDTVESVKISSLLDQMRSKNRWRLPIFDHERHVLCVVHRSIAADFVASQAGPDTATLTIGDMKSKAIALYNKVLAFAVVAANANLADVKRVMEGIEDCNDAFLTKKGTIDDVVTGWITNVELALHCAP